MKYRRLLAIILSIISCLCLFTGCKKSWHANEHEFLYEKMSEIPIEYEGYYLETNNSDPSLEFEGEYNLNKSKLIVEYKGDMGFVIKYKEKEILINSAFLQERSNIYNDINKIWDNKTESGGSTHLSEIDRVGVYDEKIFIITMGLREHLSASVKGETPYCLYYYDIELDKVYYCGFYSGELYKTGYYLGFSKGGGFQIKEEII